MTDRSKIHSRLSVGLTLAASAATVLGLSPVPAAAAELTVAEAVATALVESTGPAGTVDDSGLTDCMTNAPEAVAYRNDRIVMRTWRSPDSAIARVREALQQLSVQAVVTKAERTDFPTSTGESVMPIVTIHLRPTGQEPVPIVRLARKLREGGDRTSPDYLVSMENGPVAMWPGLPPTWTDKPAPGRRPGIGAETSIYMYDVGVAPASQSDHPPNLSQLGPSDVEQVDVHPPFGEADFYYTGHTVSMADVVNTMAPGAAVTAIRITGPDGVATDVTAARAMATTLRDAATRGTWPDEIVLAFGTTGCDGIQPGAPMAPLGLEMVAEAIDRQGRTAVVASAGNRNSSRVFYPAGFPFRSMIAVGALDTSADGDAWTSPTRDGVRAPFSNYGAWVDAWDSGVRLATRHVIGLTFEPGEPAIDGLALVGGTSYSAPKVAAMIAEVMVSRKVDSLTAWQLIAASGTPCSAAVGGGVAVALVSLGSAATTPAASPPVPLC